MTQTRSDRPSVGRVGGAALVMAAALALGALLAGCSGDDGESGATTTTAPPGSEDLGDSGEAALAAGEEYLTALTAEGTPDIDAMVALSAPGSVAERYAVHTGALTEVQGPSGDEAEPGALRIEGDTLVVTLTASDGSTVDTTWGDFTLDDEGLLDSFTINDTELDDRLIVDGDSDTVAGVTASVVSAFELVTNDSPVVVIEIENAADAPYRMRGAVYVADGERVTSVPGENGALVVPAGETARALLVFAAAPFGGTLTMEGAVAGDRFELSLLLQP